MEPERQLDLVHVFGELTTFGEPGETLVEMLQRVIVTLGSRVAGDQFLVQMIARRLDAKPVPRRRPSAVIRHPVSVERGPGAELAGSCIELSPTGQAG